MNKQEFDDDKAYDSITNRDIDELKKIRFHSRMMIEKFKNDLESLEFLLKHMDYDPGAGSCFYTNVSNNKTFDLYKQYGVSACNVDEDCVTPGQWKYMHKIEYITDEEYLSGST
jgi:hypothetical protein